MKVGKFSIFMHWFSHFYLAIFSASLVIFLPTVTGIITARILGEFIDSVLNGDFSVIQRNILIIVALGIINIIVIPIALSINAILTFKCSIRYHEAMLGKSLDKNFLSVKGLKSGASATRWELDLMNYYGFSLGQVSLIISVAVSLVIIIPILSMNFFLGIICIVASFPSAFVGAATSEKQAKFYADKLQYQETRRAIELNISRAQPFIKRHDLVARIIKNVNATFYKYFNESLAKDIKLQSKLTSLDSFLTYFTFAAIFFVGVIMTANGTASPGEVAIFIGLAAPVRSIVKDCTRISIDFKKWSNLHDKVSYFYKDFEKTSGENVTSLDCVHTDNLAFSYNPDAADFTFESFSLKLNRNSKILVRGRNGAGKSTLANILSGIILDVDIYANEKHYAVYNIDSVRARISYVSQQSFFFSGSILDNLNLVCEDDHEIKYYVNLFNLEKDLAYEIAEGGTNLSGGERQKLSIIRGLLKKADIYIFDEPLNNLDDSSRLVFSELLDKLNDAYIIISHNIKPFKSTTDVITM